MRVDPQKVSALLDLVVLKLAGTYRDAELWDAISDMRRLVDRSLYPTYELRRRAGLCGKCGSPFAVGSRCAECAKKQKASRERPRPERQEGYAPTSPAAVYCACQVPIQHCQKGCKAL